MDKETLTKLVADADITIGEVIGYEYDAKSQSVYPTFKPMDDSHNQPTMGGLWFYDLKSETWDTITLSDFLDIADDLEKVIF